MAFFYEDVKYDHMYGRTAAALGVGTYVGGVVGSVLVIAAAETGRTSPTAATVVAVTLATLVAAVARFGVAPSRLERVRRDRAAVLLLAVPVACSVAILLTWLLGTRAALEPGLAAILVAFVGYGVLRSAAKTLHARRAVDVDGERLAALPEVEDRTPSRRLRTLNAAFGVAALAGGAIAIILGESGSVWYLLVALGPLAAAARTERSVTITDRGLLFESRFRARLLEWSALEGYYLDDDLVVLRPEWWRGHLTFEGSEVDDEAVDALDRYLPRATAPVVPAGGIRSTEDEVTESADRH